MPFSTFSASFPQIIACYRCYYKQYKIWLKTLDFLLCETFPLVHQTGHRQSTNSDNPLGKLRAQQRRELTVLQIPTYLLTGKWCLTLSQILSRSSTVHEVCLTDSRIYLLLACSLYLHVTRSTFTFTWGKSPKSQVCDWELKAGLMNPDYLTNRWCTSGPWIPVTKARYTQPRDSLLLYLYLVALYTRTQISVPFFGVHYVGNFSQKQI